MNFKEIIPPRCFKVGLNKKMTLKDTAHIQLDANEIVTFKTDANNEYDITRKDWGYYATPSLNGRLSQNNFRCALVKNTHKQYYIMLVEEGKEEYFYQYLKEDKQQVICWLSDIDHLRKIENNFLS